MASEGYAHAEYPQMTKAATVKKKMPKVISAVHVEPTMDGHLVRTHHMEHETESKHFETPHEAVSLPAGHILHHIAQTLGVPLKGKGENDSAAATHEDDLAPEENEDGEE